MRLAPLIALTSWLCCCRLPRATQDAARRHQPVVRASPRTWSSSSPARAAPRARRPTRCWQAFADAARRHRAVAAGRLLGLPRLEGHARLRAQHRTAEGLRQGARRRRHLYAAGRRQRHDRRQWRDPAAIEEAIEITDERARRAAACRSASGTSATRSRSRPACAARLRTSKEATIWLAVVQKSAQVPVKGGENYGKTLTYTNIVRELTPVGSWNGKPMSLQLARTAVMRPETEAPSSCSRRATPARSSAPPGPGSGDPSRRSRRASSPPHAGGETALAAAGRRSPAGGRGTRRRPRAGRAGCRPNR